MKQKLLWAITAFHELAHDLEAGGESKAVIAKRANARAEEIKKHVKEREEQLDRLLFHYLDNAFIGIGEHGKKDYRLHPMFAKDFGDVRARIMKLFMGEAV